MVLKHLTKKDVEFKWTPECENCFQILKDFLQKAPILKYPDPQASYTLYTDASKYVHMQCILTQHSDGTDYPITYVSGLFQRITIKLGHTHQRSICNLHVSEKAQFLH